MAVIGSERHFSGVGFTLTAGTVASPTTISFKNIGASWTIPALYQPTEDAGINNGNVIRQPDQILNISFTTKVTTSQQLTDLYEIFKEGAEEIELLEEGATAAADESKERGMRAELEWDAK